MQNRQTEIDEQQKTAEEHFSYGKVYYYQKEYDLAIAEFKLSLDADPDNPNIIINIGKCHFSKEEYDNARQWFEKAAEAAPNFADAHFYLGQTYLELEKRDKAINEFKEALNINSRYKAARVSLSLLLKAGAKEIEPEKTNETEENISRQANVHFHLGNALVKKNLLQEAAAEYKEAIRLRPNYPDIRNKLGELYMRRALYNLAEEEFKLALKINPRYLEASLNLAECLRLHSEQLLDEAGQIFEKSLELSPENQLAKKGLNHVNHVKNLYFA